MKRDMVLGLIRAAAYEGDLAEATRFYVEHRISWRAYEEAVAQGRAMRERDERRRQEEASGGA